MTAPTAYMPFYGNDYFRAVAGHPDHIQVGYLKAIWYYWNHTKCQGLLDDSEFLRRVCEIDKEYWPHAKSVIFDGFEFFTINDGKWHQNRAHEEWLESERRYEDACKRTAAASIARLKKFKSEKAVRALDKARNIVTIEKTHRNDVSLRNKKSLQIPSRNS